MKSIFYGLALGLQFFTVIPLKKAFPINRQTATAMYATLPLIGLLIGTVVYSVIVGLNHLQFSPLFITILTILTSFALTGGLHLDGWVDVSDAFFSYQDKEKRHSILEDPHTGAFGVISVICLLLLKLAIVYEFIVRKPETIWVTIFIPMLARLCIIFFFITVPSMKEKGIAYYFKTTVSMSALWFSLAFYLAFLTVVIIFTQQYIIIFCILGALFACLLLKRFVLKHFGGMNGDVLGALCEGMEVILWSIILLQFI